MSEPEKLPGTDIRSIWLDEIDSTNSEAMRLSHSGQRGPIWVCANTQSAGRGRGGHLWNSRHGNLHASLLSYTTCPSAHLPQLSLLAGLAVTDILIGLQDGNPPGKSFDLKWPNDILYGDAKIGGILLESRQKVRDGGHIVIIGIGLNLTSHPNDADNRATDLSQVGIAVSRRNLLGNISNALFRRFAEWQDGAGFDVIRHAWMDRASSIGKMINFETPLGSKSGIYRGIDCSGSLLIENQNRLERYLSAGNIRFPDLGKVGGSDEQ